MIYERVAIIGVGLIGGSLALAAKKRGLVGEVTGVARSEATRLLALEMGVVDHVTANAAAAAEGADLVYVATPVSNITTVLEEIAPVVQIGCTVTDAGSVKSFICREGGRLLPACFIGGHPMAGSDRAGVSAASAQLFVDSNYLLTPEAADEELLARFVEFVRALGAHPILTTPDTHDRLVACSSHAPHLWASALALGISRHCDCDSLLPFIGKGLRDSTRIAAGDAFLWRDIFFANKQNLVASTKFVRDSLDELLKAIESDDWDIVVGLLSEARDFRESLGTGKEGNGAVKQLKIAIDGPAGAGKSSVAREVAVELGYTYIDTGAMYRAVAYRAMQRDLLPGRDDEAIGLLAAEMSFEFRTVGGVRHIFADGEDLEAKVRLPEVGRLSSPVSAIGAVRTSLVAAQRKMGAEGGVVMEGRDIGTVVFPDAELKIFLTASEKERARRRYRQMRDMNMDVSFEDILREQRVRDQRDSTRFVALLCKAPDAVAMCAYDMMKSDVVQEIIRLVRERQDNG